ncbi:hypothetical protein [Methanosarcina horonobensis]|uniref:hypothetical protein n=1 Tax=Methanosarcina horonobensis TaxID=418008 RepID=UPI000A7246F5|nr:hypothetical protein [Methanosarcina horonobensis]
MKKRVLFVTQRDFETEVKQYLTQKGYARRKQLIEDLMKKHKNELGYSLKSINRKLDNLKKQGMIIRLEYSDFGKLGIEDTDKNASYLTLKNISKITEHMDKILERLDSEESIKQKNGFKRDCPL